jgi:hypothetical protein
MKRNKDRGEERHERGLQQLLLNLERFELRGKILVAKEPQIYDSAGRLISEPDVIVIDRMNNWYNFEYKCSNKQCSKGTGQLTRSADTLKHELGISPQNYLVWGNLQYKRV